MEHLSDFVFVTVANSTLARRDAYLSHLKSGIKPDTLAALRTAPLQMTTLFPDEVFKILLPLRARTSHFLTSKVVSTRMRERRNVQITRNQNALHGRILDTVVKARKAGAGPHTTLHDRPRGSSHTSDNQCVISPVQGLLPGSLNTVKHVQFTQSPNCAKKTLNSQTQDSLSVSLNVVGHVPFVKGRSQKKDVSPVIVPTYKEN